MYCLCNKLATKIQACDVAMFVPCYFFTFTDCTLLEIRHQCWYQDQVTWLHNLSVARSVIFSFNFECPLFPRPTFDLIFELIIFDTTISDFFCVELKFTTFRPLSVYFTAFQTRSVQPWVAIVLELFGFFFHLLFILNHLQI